MGDATEVLRILLAVFAVVIAGFLFAVPATMLALSQMWTLVPSLLVVMPVYSTGLVLVLHRWIDS